MVGGSKHYTFLKYQSEAFGKAIAPDHNRPEKIDHQNPESDICLFVMYVK